MEDGRSDVGKDGHWKERGALSDGTKGDEEDATHEPGTRSTRGRRTRSETRRKTSRSVITMLAVLEGKGTQ